MDTAGGGDRLLVEDRGGTAAEDLNIASSFSTDRIIEGGGLFSANGASRGVLGAVAEKINSLESGVSASVLNDGVGYRLQLVVEKTGAANEILLDAETSGFEFDQTSEAEDALLVVGAGSRPGSGVLVVSSTNEFEEVLDGVSLTANSVSETAVEVSVSQSDQELVDSIQAFVDAYNTLSDDLDELTVFNETDLSTGLLFGTTEALRVESDLSRLVTDRYFGLGQFQSLQSIGIRVDENGKLTLNSSELQEAFAEDPQSLQSLFSASETGVVARFEAAIDRLADAENGLLTNRSDSLQSTIDANNARIERFNESLERERARLELEFFQLEQVISGLQANQQVLGQIQSIPALSSTSASGS